MQGLLINPRNATATPAEGHPADVIEGKGQVIHSHHLGNGDVLFYRLGEEDCAWTKVNGRRFTGQLFLAGGHTTIEQFKEWFSFGYVGYVISRYIETLNEPFYINNLRAFRSGTVVVFA